MPRRAKRSAWASIAQVDSDRWRIRYWAEGPDGYRRRSKTIRGTRKQAEQARAQLMLEHGEDAPCPTVRQAWERWALPDLERMVADGDLAPLTLRMHEKEWRLRIEPRWGDVPCDEVRPLAIQQHLLTMGYSQAQMFASTMSRILDYAVRYELIDHNPMRERYVMPSKSTVERLDRGVWKLGELGGVWARVRGLWWEPAFLLAAFGGCRLGESLSPRAGDVEPRDVGGVPVALVPITGQVPPSGTTIVRPKTEGSVRTVVLVGRPALRLRELAAALPPDWFLTHDGAGGVQRQSRMKDAWRAAGMEHPFRNLRNSWQTWMRWELRVPPHLIEPMMGHKLPGVTGAHYDRPTADSFVEVVVDAYRAAPFDEGWDDLGRE